MNFKKIVFRNVIIGSLSILFGTFITADDVQKDDTNNTLRGITKISDITVEGYGFEQKFKNKTGSLSVFTGDDVFKTHTKTVNELGEKVPGFTPVSLTMFNNVYIRGVGNLFDLDGRNYTVTLDGIHLTTAEGKNPLLSDNTDRIEFLRGPQQVLYGTNARAGAININTKPPAKSGGSISFGIGSKSSVTAGLSYDHVFNDKVTLGFSYDVDRENGFVKDLTLNKDLDGFNKKAWAFRAYLNPTEKTSIKLNYFKQISKLSSPIYVFIDENNNPTKGALEIGPFYLRTPKLNFWEHTADTEPYDNRTSEGFGIRIAQELTDKMILSYAFSRAKYNSYSLVDIDAGNYSLLKLIGLDIFQDYKGTSTHHNLKLTYQDKYIDWILGADYYNDTNKRLMYLNYLNLSLLKINAIRINNKMSGRGFYGQVKLKPHKRFDLTLGFRNQKDKASAEDMPFSSLYPLESAYNYLIYPAINDLIIGREYHKKMSTTQNVYFITPTFHVNDRTNIYFSFTRAYQPGGYMNLIFPSSFKPEVGNVREIGFTINEFNNRLFMTGAYFDSKYHDYQFFNIARYTMMNIGDVRIKGYELSISYQIHPGVLLYLMHSKVKPVIENFAQKTKYEFINNNKLLAPILDIGNFSGKVIPWVPLTNTVVGVTFFIPIQKYKGLIAWDINLRRKGKYYVDFFNTKALHNSNTMKAVNFIDTSISYRQGNHELVFWGKNLANKEDYQMALYAGFKMGVYGKKRSVGLSYKYRF